MRAANWLIASGENLGHTTKMHFPLTPEAETPLQVAAGWNTSDDSAALDLPSRVLRILDAAANRASEGLRVIEDYVRFALDDWHLTTQLKSLRHDLTAILSNIDRGERIAARESQGDVGADAKLAGELARQDVAQVITASFQRLQQALRSLEEFSKLSNAAAARRFEQLRYRVYTIERAVELTGSSLCRLAHARLYVLVDGGRSEDAFRLLAESLVGAGVPLVQLREKSLDDRTLLARARLLREITRGSQTLLIINDRADLAMLADADGVHVGQQELSVKDARALVGPRRLVGVSTHSIEQARQAVLDGSNYIGIGPTFPGRTKQFPAFPGLDFVRAVSHEIRLPAFAIGGITLENLGEVLASGATRACVSAAVCGATDPAAAARAFLAHLPARSDSISPSTSVSVPGE